MQPRITQPAKKHNVLCKILDHRIKKNRPCMFESLALLMNCWWKKRRMSQMIYIAQYWFPLTWILTKHFASDILYELGKTNGLERNVLLNFIQILSWHFGKLNKVRVESLNLDILNTSYFELLNEVIEKQKLKNSSLQVYNWDEASLLLDCTWIRV